MPRRSKSESRQTARDSFRANRTALRFMRHDPAYKEIVELNEARLEAEKNDSVTLTEKFDKSINAWVAEGTRDGESINPFRRYR